MSAWLSTPRFQGETLEVWRERLQSPDPEQRRLAVEALTFLPINDAETRVRLSEFILTEEDAATRTAALARLVGLLAPAGAGADDPLTVQRQHILEHYLEVARTSEAPDRRTRAVLALVALTKASPAPTVPGEERGSDRPTQRLRDLLIERIGVETGQDRRTLLRLLEPMVPLPAEAEPPLLAAWRMETGEHCVRAVACLTAIPRLSEKAVPALLEQMAQAELTQRILPHLQRHGARAIPGLLEALHPQDWRASVAQQVFVLLGPQGIPALQQAWQQQRGPARALAAQTLARTGPLGLAVLLPDLVSPDESTAELIRVTYRGAGPSVRSFLKERLASAQEPLRTAIQDLLLQMGEGSSEKPQ